MPPDELRMLVQKNIGTSWDIIKGANDAADAWEADLEELHVANDALAFVLNANVAMSKRLEEAQAVIAKLRKELEII